MPKMIGNSIYGATHIAQHNARPSDDLVRLSYSQAVLLPASDISCSLDTTDRGGPGRVGKRWFRWFAAPRTILAHPRSTQIMRARAARTIGLPTT